MTIEKIINIVRCKVKCNATEMVEVEEKIVMCLQKEIPFRPKESKLLIGVGRCKCGAEFLDKDTDYCGNCGQKLDWSVEK